MLSAYDSEKNSNIDKKGDHKKKWFLMNKNFQYPQVTHQETSEYNLIDKMKKWMKTKSILDNSLLLIVPSAFAKLSVLLSDIKKEMLHWAQWIEVNQ